MRYEDWDVLLFPKDSKTPMKEFKTQCHVVHDNEFAYSTGSYGLPTMTCFMPGLPTGTPFSISLHCWNAPEVSKFTQTNFKSHHDLVKFEARVYVDGRLVASASFDRTGPWPQLVSRCFDFTKNGELQHLKFPAFRSELLRQNYWSPADDLGRIKVIISEGFPRDSISVPMERVKNIIAFSFQHAPIDILECSAIAWPNPAMWRRGPFNPTMPVPTEHPDNGAEAHIHSPRRRSDVGGGPSSGFEAQHQTETFLGSMPNTQSFLQRGPMTSMVDSSGAAAYAELFNNTRSDTSSGSWAPTGLTPVGYNSWNPSSYSRSKRDHAKSASSNVSMADFVPDAAIGDSFQQLGDMYQYRNHEDQDVNPSSLQVPTNTPTTYTGQHLVDELLGDANISSNGFPSELATSLTNSLLNQPLPLPPSAAGTMSRPGCDINPRKEDCARESSLAVSVAPADHIDPRKTSQSIFDQPQRKDIGNRSREASLNNSPPSSRAFSGIFSNHSSSAGDFGHSSTNVNPVSTFNQPNLDVSTPSAAPSSGEKGVKRSRRATPASSRAIDDEDEPRRSTPRVRIGFGEGMAN